MKWSDVMKKRYDEIINAMIELDAKNRKYQTSLYIYEDGSLYQFENVGGNSWLDDDHYVVWKNNNEFNEEYDAYSEEELLDICKDNREYYEDILDSVIKEAEREEKSSEFFGR